MAGIGNDDRVRVLVPQALGADEFLRVTWHRSRHVLVFSHWQGNLCTAATPVRVADIAELAELTVTALTRSLVDGSASWAPPRSEDRVPAELALRRPA